MDELEASIYDGETVIVTGVDVLLDTREAPGGTTDSPGWHVHADLPLDVVIEPAEELRLVTADGREAVIEECEPITVEGDRVLHVFRGLGPLASKGA